MNLIKYGEKFFDELEIHMLSKREISASAELNQISSAVSSDINITVVRGVKDGRMGISIVDSNEDSKIKEGIEEAYKLSKHNIKDENWPGFPDAQNYREHNSKDLEIKDADHFVNIVALSLKHLSEKRPNAVVVGAEAGAAKFRSVVMNSRGVDVEQSDFLSYFMLMLIERENGKVTPSIFDMDVQKEQNLETDKVIESCIQKLKWAGNVKKANNEEATLIMEPFAMAEILNYSLFPAFSGERKVKGTSVLVDKIGERVMSDKVSIYDDPFHNMSIYKVVADDEGVATQTNKIVERGKFRGFLWNHYWASVAGVESTGNASRSFRTGAVGIGAHNMVMDGGAKKLEEIISEMDKGYVVSLFQGAHSSNPDTGSISAVANPAFVVEDGEIKGSTVFMVSGNIYDMMQNVVEVSSEQKAVYMMGRGIYPYVAFENVKIAAVSR